MVRNCTWCHEPLEPGEGRLKQRLKHMHRECAFRSLAGSVAHIEKRCGCYVPGSEEGDPPGMSLRDAAKLAWDRFKQLNNGNTREARRERLLEALFRVRN